MTSYQGRKAPNVSRYIADLNTIPTDEEMAASNQETGLNLADDFALFTNTDLYDFDLRDLGDFNPPANYNPEQEVRARRLNASAFRQENMKPNEAFPNGNFQFDPYAQFPNIAADPGVANIQPNLYPSPSQASPTATSPTSPQSNGAGEKRKLTALGSPKSSASGEDAARVAAEEDKRRRNTAASARFRVKKKQREQALEKTAKEMTEKVSALEARVVQLETENKWLKNLLTEKHENKDVAGQVKKSVVSSGTDISEPRSTGDHTDGVGTTLNGNKA